MGTRLVYRRPGPSRAVAAANPSGRNPPRRSCTTGAAPASSALTTTWTPATWSAGRASSQRPGPPRRAAVASAEARSATAGSTTSRGRPVEPEVATSTPSPGPDIGSVGRAAAVAGGGTRAYGGAAASRGNTAGPPSSASATAAARAVTASGEPSSRMIRTGPSSVARRRHRTSCEPSHTECTRRTCCSGCAGFSRCASAQVGVRQAAIGRCSLRAVDHHPGRRRRGVVGAIGDLPVHADQAGGEVSTSTVVGQPRCGQAVQNGRGGRGVGHTPSTRQPTVPVRRAGRDRRFGDLSSARGTGSSRGRASAGRRRGPPPPRRSGRPAASPRPRTAVGRPARRRAG